MIISVSVLAGFIYFCGPFRLDFNSVKTKN